MWSLTLGLSILWQFQSFCFSMCPCVCMYQMVWLWRAAIRTANGVSISKSSSTQTDHILYNVTKPSNVASKLKWQNAKKRKNVFCTLQACKQYMPRILDIKAMMIYLSILLQRPTALIKVVKIPQPSLNSMLPCKHHTFFALRFSRFCTGH